MTTPSSPCPEPSRATPAPPRRQRAVWTLAGLVLAAHLALLQWAPQWLALASTGTANQAGLGGGGLRPVTSIEALQAPDAAGRHAAAEPTGSAGPTDRQPAMAPPSAGTPPHTEPGQTGIRRTPAPAQKHAAAEQKVSPDTIQRAETAAKPVNNAVAEARGASAALAPPADAAQGEPSATRGVGPDGTPVPPPSALLSYSLQRGMLRGSGVLAWHNEGPRYRMHLEGQLPVIGRIFLQHSEGGFDAAGLAPLRHTEQRMRRSERAVNFVRPVDGSAARITFSASTASEPLHAGAQDRLSWMAQIATRLAGARQLPLGTRLGMDVASTGGDVQHWVFVLTQVEADGTWHWRRTSDQPNDTLAEVWTDPANGHWPSRVRLSEPRAEPLELTLQDVRRLP